jgi:hypothetical protein
MTGQVSGDEMLVTQALRILGAKTTDRVDHDPAG